MSLLTTYPPSSYKLSLWAAQQASKLFKAAGLPYERPNDYYAEMLKSDEHMERIRQKLLDDSANIKASEQAKKQRHLKKFGKQVQVEKQKEREKSKREMNDKVKSFRKSELYHCWFLSLFCIPCILILFSVHFQNAKLAMMALNQPSLTLVF